MNESRYGSPTVKLIQSLFDKGIRQFSVIMRHSARHYSDEINMEPFMSLTEEGKILSFEMGTNLPAGLTARFFSSHIGRCIETAYQVDKGYTKQQNGTTISNIVSSDISPFYVVDIKELLKIIMVQETELFIRNWLDGKIPPSAIVEAKESAERMFTFMENQLGTQQGPMIDICVTHDWNIYILKEIGLGMPHETYGKIEYLEGIVLFKDGEDTFITHSLSEPKPFQLP